MAVCVPRKGLFAMDGIEAFRTKLTACAIAAMIVYLVIAQ
jgi:hypothetical protein